MVGDNFNDFMNSSPQSLKISQSRAGGSGSRSTSPNQEKSSPLLKVQEMLTLQSQGSEVQPNTSNLLKGIDIAIHQQNLRGKQRSETARAAGPTDNEDGGDIDIDIDDIEC